MSLDYYLYKKEATKITEDFLIQSLSSEFEILETKLDPEGLVDLFYIKKIDSTIGALDFNYQKNGQYWVYTYDYEDASFAEFIKVVSEIAEKLGMLIEDSQSGVKDIKPSEFSQNKAPRYLKMQRKITREFIPRLFSGKADISGYVVKEYVLVAKDGSEILFNPNVLKEKLSSEFKVKMISVDGHGSVKHFSVIPNEEGDLRKRAMGSKILEVDFNLSEDKKELVGSNKDKRNFIEQMDFLNIINTVFVLLGLQVKD